MVYSVFSTFWLRRRKLTSCRPAAPALVNPAETGLARFRCSKFRPFKKTFATLYNLCSACTIFSPKLTHKVHAETHTPENELLQGCLRNERTAQRQLYEQYKRAMYTVAFRILNDADHAHDALQDGFIEVFKNIESFKGQSTIGAWIKVIVVRKALAKLKAEQKFETLDTDQHDSPVAWPDTLTAQYLDKAIRELPAGYRSVFTLIEVEGYAHKEVAEMLNISESTSKSQLFHAKKQLQKKLSELVK